MPSLRQAVSGPLRRCGRQTTSAPAALFGLEPRDAALEPVDLLLQREDPFDALEVDALVGQPLHLAERRDVAQRSSSRWPAWVRPGETSPSRSYWRRVCACRPLIAAATEMT